MVASDLSSHARGQLPAFAAGRCRKIKCSEGIDPSLASFSQSLAGSLRWCNKCAAKPPVGAVPITTTGLAYPGTCWWWSKRPGRYMTP